MTTRKFHLFAAIVVVLNLVPLQSYCQYFQRVHDLDTTADFGWNIFALQDGQYFITNSALNNNTFRNETAWMTVSQDGTTITSKKSLNSVSLNYYQGLLSGEVKKLTDGGYLVPLSVAKSGRSSIGLMRLNAQLDTVFTKFYTDTSLYFEDVLTCEVLSNGDFMIGGFTAINGQPRDSALIIRTDGMGNIIWRREYRKLPNADEWPTIVNLQEIDNNKILVGAMSTHLVYVGSDQYGHNTPWFMIMDGSGNVVKDTAYANMSYAGGGRIYKDMYGGYYHTGSFDSMYTQDPTDLINFPQYLAHINDNFEIDWVRSFGTNNGHKVVWVVDQLSDGSFQVVGGNGADTISPRGWAARFDHNGWTIWDHSYVSDSSSPCYLRDFDLRPDGTMVMVGAAINDTISQWRGQDLWLVSVDANGCLVPGCDPTIIRTTEQKEEDVLVYPNPATGVLNVVQSSASFNTAVIINSIGQQLSAYKLDKENHLDISSFPPGVYYLQLTGEHGREIRSFVKM